MHALRKATALRRRAIALHRRTAVVALLALTASTVGAPPSSGVAEPVVDALGRSRIGARPLSGAAKAAGVTGAAGIPGIPGAPNITSVTVGDAQLTPNWAPPADTGSSAVTDYEFRYRAGTSGDWSLGFDYSYDSGVQTGTDLTWSHKQNPLDLGSPTGDIADYVERTAFNGANGLYRIKQGVFTFRVRVDGEADTPTTVRLMHSTTRPVDLRWSGIELARAASSGDRDAFSITGLTRELPADAWFWLDGYDRTSTGNGLALTATAISDRRLRLDVSVVSATKRSAAIKHLTNGISYQMQVRAVNGAGWGPWSDSIAAMPVGSPNTPTGLRLESGASKLIARWSPPANDGGSPVTDYDIQYRPDTSGADWTDSQAGTVSTAPTAEITGLTDGSDYQVRVRAVNAHGDSGWTAPVTDTPGKPSPPAVVFSTVRRPLPPGKLDKGGLLSIALASQAHGSAVTDYDLRYREAGTTTWYTHRDRSHDSGKLRTSEASGPADPIDFGTFTSPTGGAAVTREAIGTGANAKHGLYKFSKPVSQIWIRSSGTVTGGGTVEARWDTSKPTAATLATAGQRIFSAATEPDHTFWQDGWVVDLPAGAYVWLHTDTTETLTVRRLQLDFTDDSASGAMLLSGLRNGRTYELRARAENARGWGAWSPASGTPGTPMRPVVAAPAPGHRTLAVAWGLPSSDNGSSVSGYDVRYRAGASGAWESWAHTTSARTASITGLTDGTEYEVQVRAVNARGAGFWSPGVKGTPAPQAPDAPAAPALTSSGTTMTVGWTAPTANGAVIADYDVEYSSDGGTTWTPLLDTTFTSPTYTDSDHSDQTAGDPIDLKQITGLPVTITREQIGTHWGVYKIGGALGALQVRVHGKTSQLDFVRARYGTAKPAADSNLHTQGTQLFEQQLTSTADFDVSGVIDLPPTGAYFWVYTSTRTQIPERAVQVSAPSISTTTSATVPGLTDATTYRVRVRARNSVGTGAWSPASVHTIGRPSAPAAPTLTSGDSQLTAVWTAASPNGSPITDYDVQYCSTDCASDGNGWTAIPDTVASTALSATIAGLTNGTTHQVRVSAQNSAGNGPWSAAAAIEVGLPSAPSDLAVVSGNGTLTASWNASAGNGSEVEDYDVGYCSANCDSGDSVWQEHSPLVPSRQTSATLTGLTNGTAYRIRVRADNRHGSSPWSPAVSAVPGVPVAPSAPALTAGDRKIIVTWDKPLVDNGSLISDYDVRYCHTDCASGGSGWTEIADTEDSTALGVLLSELEIPKTYRVQVRAENAAGAGPWSAAGTLTLAVSPVPDISFRACDPDGVTQIWIGYSCYIKAGERGIRSFDTVTLIGSSSDYVEAADYLSSHGLVNLMAYNPNGGLAEIATSLNGEERDFFLVDVIRFGIRSHELNGALTANQYSYLTVRLHSPSHMSNDPYKFNGTDYARSWVQLSLPSGWAGLDHRGTWTDDPVRIIAQYGDSVTFKLLPDRAGTHTIGINAYNPDPDPSCPTQGPLRCFYPPVDSKMQAYTIASPITTTAAIKQQSEPPAAPGGLTATVGDGSVALSWNDPSDPGISGYEYRIRWPGVAWGQWTAVPGSGAGTVAHTLTGLDNGVEYRFKIRAVNAAGASPATPRAHPWYVTATPQAPPEPSPPPPPPPPPPPVSEPLEPPEPPISKPLDPSEPPAAPEGLTATAGDGSVVLGWDDPSDPGISGYEYRVRWPGVAWGQWTAVPGSGAATTSHTLTGLDNGVEHRFKIRAVNAAGASPATPRAYPWYVTATPQAPTDTG